MTFNVKSDEHSEPTQEDNDDQLNELLISLGYERLLITDFNIEP